MLGAPDYFGSTSFSAYMYYFLDGSAETTELTLPLFDHNLILGDNISIITDPLLKSRVCLPNPLPAPINSFYLYFTPTT